MTANISCSERLRQEDHKLQASLRYNYRHFKINLYNWTRLSSFGPPNSSQIIARRLISSECLAELRLVSG